MTTPRALFTAAQLRQIEAAATAAGVPGYALMKAAGAAACQLLLRRWPESRTIAIVCGSGNNAGDGYVVARCLHEAGRRVVVLAVGDPSLLGGEAGEALADFRATGIAVVPFGDERSMTLLGAADVVVDALLGIGVRAPLREPFARAIEAINGSGRPVLALDLPSGLDPDTGHALPAVRAQATLCFVALKQGLFLGDGPGCRGELHFDALGTEEAAARVQPSLRRLAPADFAAVLQPRPRSGHKGMFGRVLIVGGGPGMPGAVRLAGEAALRVGAGLVTIASLGAHLPVILGARPELMFRGIDDARELAALLPAFDVIAVGPGLGTGDWSRAVLQTVLSVRTPGQGLVIDADALNLLAGQAPSPRLADAILTPHPGEAARLLGWTAERVQADRPAALRALTQLRGGVVVLKGAGTLIGREGECGLLCEAGNPGMAVPGMGDVLTGAIAGLLAQLRDPFAAAAGGVWLHATAGDRCAAGGQRGILALDVATGLRAVLGELA